MAEEDEVQAAIDEAEEFVADLADNMDKFSQAESAEIYESIASTCTMRAQAIRAEM